MEFQKERPLFKIIINESWLSIAGTGDSTDSDPAKGAHEQAFASPAKMLRRNSIRLLKLDLGNFLGDSVLHGETMASTSRLRTALQKSTKEIMNHRVTFAWTTAILAALSFAIRAMPRHHLLIGLLVTLMHVTLELWFSAIIVFALAGDRNSDLSRLIRALKRTPAFLGWCLGIGIRIAIPAILVSVLLMFAMTFWQKFAGGHFAPGEIPKKAMTAYFPLFVIAYLWFNTIYFYSLPAVALGQSLKEAFRRSRELVKGDFFLILAFSAVELLFGGLPRIARVTIGIQPRSGLLYFLLVAFASVASTFVFLYLTGLGSIALLAHPTNTRHSPVASRR